MDLKLQSILLAMMLKQLKLGQRLIPQLKLDFIWLPTVLRKRRVHQMFLSNVAVVRLNLKMTLALLESLNQTIHSQH